MDKKDDKEASSRRTTNQDGANEGASNSETPNQQHTDSTTPTPTNTEDTNPPITNQDAQTAATTESTDHEAPNQQSTSPVTANLSTSTEGVTDQDASNQETANQNTPSQEATTPDTTRQAATTPDTTRQAATTPDTTRQEATTPDTTRQEATTPDTTRQEATTPDTIREAATTPDTTRQAATTPDTSRQEATTPDTTRREATDTSSTGQGTFDLDMICQEAASSPTDPIARKAARFDPSLAITSSTQIAKSSAWRTADSLQRLSDSRELEADIFEIVLFHVGEFGRYQKLLLIAIIPFAVYFSWVYFTPMFLLLTPKPYWCKVPELSSLTKNQRRDLSAPGATVDAWDGCKVFKTDWSQVITNMQPPTPDTPLVDCKTGWEHDFTEVPYETVTSERGWLCHRAKYSLFSQTAFFAGSLAGGLLFGWMADTHGRVPALIAVNLVGGVAGMITIYTTRAWDFILCRFFCGMSFDNCFMIAYILVLEYVGPKHRTMVANLPLVLYDGTGAVTLPWIAYFVASWRWFAFITSMAMFIGVLAPWLLPESARWLVSRGRIDEAVKVLKRFEKINKTYIPDSVMKQFIKSSIAADQKEKDSFMSMFKSRLLRNTCIFMATAYCFLAVAYDALVRVSESFGFDFFITFTLNAFVEIPSVIAAALLLDRLGRRNLTFGPTLLGAVFILITMFVPKGVTRVCSAVVARFLINLAFTVSVQWVAEILPTPFRATGSAAMHMCGFASSLLSPFIAYSEHYWSRLPLLILVILSVIAAAFSLLVPETKGEEMPQTIADAENIILENSLYGLHREAVSISRAFSSVRSSLFIEPIYRSPEGRVSLRLSRSQLATGK